MCVVVCRAPLAWGTAGLVFVVTAVRNKHIRFGYLQAVSVLITVKDIYIEALSVIFTESLAFSTVQGNK